MNRNLIFRLAEHSAWKRCSRLFVAGRSFDEARTEIARNIRRVQNNDTASCHWIIAGWKAGLEHARQDVIRSGGVIQLDLFAKETKSSPKKGD
jgi:hypothetical protein